MRWEMPTSSGGVFAHLYVGAIGAKKATTADIVQCLKANPEACAEVLAGMGPTHFAARDAEWWHDRFVAEKARAEQAEHSLVASERALAALRYQAQAGGCELSTVGENSYHCRADALCGLCRLRHRASQAERSLATLRELIHTASGLDDHRYSAEQMVKEMAERWQGASDDCEKAEQALATVTAERDEARAELRDVGERLRELQAHALPTDCVRCGGVGAEPPCCPESGPCECCGGWTAHKRLVVAEPSALRAKLAEVERERDEARSERDTLGRRVEDAQAALNECGAGFTGQKESTRIRALRARLAKAEKVVGAARKDVRHFPRFDQDVARTRAALRALDSPVGGSSVDPRPLCIRCAKPWVPLEGCDATVELCPACWYRGERPGVAGTDSEGGAPCTGQVTPGTVSGGASGAATPEGGHAAPTGGPMPPPEPAGSSCRCGAGCKPVPRYAGDDDSPVGVAATACDHKRQRCENDHAVCRDCGAVNRAVTGVVDWGPPETARDDGSTGAVA